MACARVSNNVVSFDSSNANSIGGNVFVSEDCYFNMTGGTLEGRKDNAGNYTYELQSQFGGGVGSMGITSLTGGTIRSCKAKHGGGVGSYGGIRVNNETLKVNIDLRANYLKIGSINILDCQAEEVGSSIAAGYEIEMFGSPNINGEISLSALEKAFLKLGFEISLLENDAKRYPEIYVSGSFNPAQQLKINFSQASIEAKVSLNSGSSYDYNLELTPGMMHDKFVDTEEQFVTYANGVSEDTIDFYVTTNNGNTKYVVAKYVDALITNSTFNKDTKVYDTPSHTGNALILLSAFEISNMYVYTLTADQSAYTVGFGGENGIFTDYYDPNESVQTFAPKTATTTTNGFILNLPSTYDGKSVIGITDNGFKSARVASVVMPEGYIVIGEHAFDGCSSLTSVTIPSTIETVGVCAFMGCMNMAGTIDLSNAETIGNYAFYNCSSVTGTIDLSNVTTIGSRAFEGCSSLTGLMEQLH